MIKPPDSVATLIAGPLVGLVIGGAFALLLTPTMGEASAWKLGAATGALLSGLLGWITLRSDYGSRHGLVGGAGMLIILFVAGCGGVQLMLAVMGHKELGSLAAWTTSLSMVLSAAVTAWLRFRRLSADGPDSAWVTAHVDKALGHLRRLDEADEAASATAVSPWFVAGLGVNAPLLYRASGYSDAQALPFVVATVLGAALWLCATKVGPLAGASLFLLTLERRLGRRLVSPDFEDLQALRRSHWFTRALMPESAEPPIPADQRRKRSAVRRRGK